MVLEGTHKGDEVNHPILVELEEGPGTAIEIASAMGRKRSNVADSLSRLEAAGYVVKRELNVLSEDCYSVARKTTLWMLKDHAKNWPESRNS